MGRATRALEALRGTRWLALDTEATGLGPYDEVIEVAVVDAEGAPQLVTLLRPSRPVTARSTAVHGLSAATLESAPSWPQIWPRLRAIIERSPLVAWNAAFDLRLLRQTCDRHRLPFAMPTLVCLRAAFVERHPRTRSTLAAACLALGIDERPTHRALQDARVASRVARELLGPAS